MTVKEQIVRLTTDGEETRVEVIGEIVRCRDCKHQTVYGCDLYEDYYQHGLGFDDDFCSRGERSEE